MERPSTLRSGYTTEACATAATRGALLALIHQRPFSEATIRLPLGQQVTFVLHTYTYTPDEGRSSVIKDAGDDPDVTHLAEICSRVMWHTEPGVHVVRGAAEALVRRTCSANTAQEVSELMSEAGVTAFHALLCRAAWQFADALMHGAYTLEVILLGRAGEVLGRYGDKNGAR